MTERSQLIEWIRTDLAGPSHLLTSPMLIEFTDRIFSDQVASRSGPLAWRPDSDSTPEEVLYFESETPHRKYGVGLLHPFVPAAVVAPEQLAAEASDTVGAETETADEEDSSTGEKDQGDLADPEDDFEVTSPDVRHPSTIGISFCVRLQEKGQIVVKLPRTRRFAWQDQTSPAFSLNGRYEKCTRRWTDNKQRTIDSPMWRRLPAVLPDCEVIVNCEDLAHHKKLDLKVTMPNGSPIALTVQVYPRRIQGQDGLWLLTIVLRNTTPPAQGTETRESTLYQTYFEVLTEGCHFEKYLESQRPFNQLDPDEQSLSLLYRESATWGIGHGCAAGWDAEPQQVPRFLYADILPAVETPSMTPEITGSDGKAIKLSMRSLANLPDDKDSDAWKPLTNLSVEYKKWIDEKQAEAESLPNMLKEVAERHLDAAASCLNRIKRGIEILQTDAQVRHAFRFANLAMLLQQIATKQLKKRSLEWDAATSSVSPTGDYDSPWLIYKRGGERPDLGYWRAFQVAFVLMSIEGVIKEESAERSIVDLIWFPTGGGKTEAYLAVMALYMSHLRLQMKNEKEALARDGTNVLMRYTLRMLTTQQFQRAAGLIAAMEFLRRNPTEHQIGALGGIRFSLGLWIGGEGSPNKIAQARTELGAYRLENSAGNPLVLTECPWCRAEIGRFDGPRPKSIPQAKWNSLRVRGISDHPAEGPLLHCSDGKCSFGSEQWQNWLPVEVIDERIYNNPPSLVIATADKLAIVAYRPTAGALFGREVVAGQFRQTHLPPGLIVQDELHLISGPLGTIYGLYEGIFERLCSRLVADQWIKPKLIASTATIRGADDQVRALYGRSKTQLFPSPGLLMGDSFFGRYAREEDGTGRLKPGRLYLGIHANEYGSVLTTQVRVFSSALFRPQSLPSANRDAWWTLLVFYNSIRELGGAKTLFDSDIRSRLKFVFNRENVPSADRRNLRIVEELTSRLSQSEIVEMMDRLSVIYSPTNNEAFDACLASNIIEVGVDIDRLSLMGVVGQPKTTAQYIQVTGRVGRRWWDRPGLILTIYNPSKSRDRSHFEQFHSYHRRLYERVEPTSATPFAISAIKRALPGALITWSRQQCLAPVQDFSRYQASLDSGYELMKQRCLAVQIPEDQARSLEELDRVRQELESKWGKRPQDWEEFPPSTVGEYLMLWPGQFATVVQKQNGVVVPSSMRQVDGTAELTITQGY